ncbi:twin-arginine translocase subunit TatC [Picrophilus oshimae]|uniref:Sec-independent protein translocase protein TatC n=1 Tax=Picrophilus torridus (strain ATCC 700027 / DSM 9790 / JCM 10055 / NBRC 100828 / KAW 2/3) TaxID=1122961 RepID=A0A8G2FXK6_PICTO|nr:twin-arginine translocase subunit TatC [Picrophilus oshimae]SMD31340.1 Sec-independent protein translocase TatC [Picrophilus oshimae DSM 9789]
MENEIFNYLVKYSDEIRYRLIRSLTVFGIFFAIFLMFQIRYISLFNYRFLFIYPDPFHNIGAQFLFIIKDHVLPEDTKLLVIKPTDGVMADFYSCMSLSLIISMPYIAYQLMQFVSPALKNSERELIKSIIIPASLLFAAGAFMGLYFVAPEIFIIFQDFNVGLGASTTLSISSFVSFLFIYVIAFGLSFELPVIMVGLTRFGIVTYEQWAANWRYAVIGAFIFGMIFSPGVTGFTMIILAVPIIALYFAGLYISKRVEKKEKLISITNDY